MDPVTYVHDVRGWPLAALVGGTAVAAVTASSPPPGTWPAGSSGSSTRSTICPTGCEEPLWLFQLAGVLLVPLVIAVVAAALRRYRLAGALVALMLLKLVVEKAGHQAAGGAAAPRHEHL